MMGRSSLLLLMLTVVCLVGVMQGSKLEGVLEAINEDIKEIQKVVDTEAKVEEKRIENYPSGAVYIHWGRTTCRDGSRGLIYTGVAGGGNYAHSGGSAEHLCLPKEPIWGTYNDKVKNTALLYGAEYQLASDNAPFSSANSAGGLQDQDIPCAVCESLEGSQVMMVPARNRCYPGWRLEYKGYLMGSHRSRSNTNYICMDEAPEPDFGGHQKKQGDLLYPVEGICGSLPCPPYVNGREITCAVCSK